MQNNFTISSIPNKVVDENGNEYRSIRSLSRAIGVPKTTLQENLRYGQSYRHNGHVYRILSALQPNVEANVPQVDEQPVDQATLSPEYAEFLKQREVTQLPFEIYDFKFSRLKQGSRYAIALFSDAHIEETVNPDSVLGLNEYNVDIAKKRIEKYFVNLANCLNEDKVEDLIFASLGDTISSYLHDELSQTNGLSPLEATYEAQNLIYSGLRYICENTHLNSIKFIGIVGNHGRVTKKVQHANGYAMSYEWLMYRNIKKECELTNLPIEFCIPSSEMAIVDTNDKKRYIFIHGFQIKGTGNGTVCGIYPALNRLSLKYGKVFKQDKIYLGHFHSCTSIPNAVVNGSIIGYNAFSLSNGFGYEEPAQMYECYDTINGLLLTRQIYCR